MKKFFSLAAAIILLSPLFVSCKKDKETTAQKVQHNWTLVSIVDNSHDAGGDDMDTTAVSGDFMNFNSNGTVAFQVDGQGGTVSYSIVSDSQLLLGVQNYSIKTLTDTQLILYVKDVTSATEYDEETVTLKR